MKNARAVLRQVLEDIKPDEKYKKEIFDKLNEIISKINKGQKDFRAILGGSGAKGTWLRSFDADIFVLFNYAKYRQKSDKISDILEKVLRKKFVKITRLHGSRDYFQINDRNYTFEIIPILEIKNSKQAINITDISPLHSKWVLKHKKISDDMKLAKQFAKAQRVYGAESHLRGFSGYVCEILAVYYGSFANLMRNAAKWQDKAVIDVEKHYKGEDVFKVMNSSKLESPLIVVDPVQKERNAAAALSIEKFNDFRNAAKLFMKNPSKKFFEQKDIESELSKKYRSKKIIKIEVEPLYGKADVVGGKIQKIQEFFLANLQKNGFKVHFSSWVLEKEYAELYFAVDKNPISQKKIIEGPLLSMQSHAENFRKIHKKTFAKRGRIFAEKKRDFVLAEKLAASLQSDPYVMQRCKKTKILVL